MLGRDGRSGAVHEPGSRVYVIFWYCAYTRVLLPVERPRFHIHEPWACQEGLKLIKVQPPNSRHLGKTTFSLKTRCTLKVPSVGYLEYLQSMSVTTWEQNFSFLCVSFHQLVSSNQSVLTSFIKVKPKTGKGREVLAFVCVHITEHTQAQCTQPGHSACLYIFRLFITPVLFYLAGLSLEVCEGLSFVASSRWFVKKLMSFKLLFNYNTPHRKIKLFWELKSVKSFCPDNLWKLQQKQSKSQSWHEWEAKKSAWMKSLLNSRNKRIGFPFVSFILAIEKSKCVSSRILGTSRMETRRKMCQQIN